MELCSGNLSDGSSLSCLSSDNKSLSSLDVDRGLKKNKLRRKKKMKPKSSSNWLTKYSKSQKEKSRTNKKKKGIHSRKVFKPGNYVKSKKVGHLLEKKKH